MRRQFGAIAVLSAAAAVLSLAGCGGSSTSPGSSNQVTSFKNLPAADQQELGESVVEEVEANVGSFTSFDPYTSVLGFNRVANHRLTGIMLAMHNSHSPRFQTSSPCTETENPADPTYSPAGIPDTLSITETCAITEGSETLDLADTINIGDPQPTSSLIDYEAGVGLNLTETGDSSGNISLNVDGNASVSENGNTISEQAADTLAATISNNPSNDNGTIKIGAAENASYAYVGSVATSFDQLLQDPGTYTLSGNWTYQITSTSLNGNLSFSVATQGSGLSIDPVNCQTNFSHIVSGTIVVTFSDGSTVTALWSGCPATPSITIS